MQLSPLRQFILAAMLWLPACFAIWAALVSAILWPVARIAEFVLQRLLPRSIEAIEQNGAVFEIVTRILTEPDASGRVGQMVLTAAPMVYAWCLPLFAGLVMAAPISGRQRLLQFAIGIPVLWLVVCWGAVFDALYLLQFKAGPLGAAALQLQGWSAEGVGLGYQFGYLILPAVTPVAMWILLNARFLEELVGWHGEPEAVSRGPTPGADPGPTAATESDDPAAVVEGRAIDGAGVAPVAAPTDEESKS